MVSQSDDRVEASVISKLSGPSSCVQVGRVAFFPFRVLIVRVVVLVVEEQLIILKVVGVVTLIVGILIINALFKAEGIFFSFIGLFFIVVLIVGGVGLSCLSPVVILALGVLVVIISKLRSDTSSVILTEELIHGLLNLALLEGYSTLALHKLFAILTSSHCAKHQPSGNLG